MRYQRRNIPRIKYSFWNGPGIVLVLIAIAIIGFAIVAPLLGITF